MTSTRHAAYQLRRWGTGLGLASAAVLAATVIGTAAAPAARADDVTVPTDPIALLDGASAALTQANDLLSGVELPDHQSLIDHQMAIQDTSLEILGKSAEAQEPFLSSLPEDSFWSEWVTEYFTAVDQQFYQAGEAVLAADQAFDTTEPLTGSALFEATFDVFAADLQLLSADFGVIIPDFIAGVFGDFDL